MDDLRTRALLVDFDPARTGAIGTTLTRAEVAETAARGEFPATLLLDIDRVGTDDGGEVTAHAQIAVDWDKDTIDRLLASTDDDEIALWFDEHELAHAFDDPEVEGHGLRQKAAVLAIAVTAAGASTTPAFAQFAADTSGGGSGGGSAAAAYSVDPQASGHGAVVQLPGTERGLLRGEQLAAGSGQTGAARWSGAERALQHDETLAMQRGESTAGQTGAARWSGAESALQHDETLAMQRGESTAGATEATSSGGGLSSGELAGIAGFGAVLISAAGFGVARKRTPPAQPA